MDWEIYTREAEYTVWVGRDVHGVRVWSCTTNRGGVAAEPRSHYSYSRQAAVRVYLQDHTSNEEEIRSDILHSFGA